MGLALWQYIVIILASEITVVTVILVIIWQYCKWSFRNGRAEKSSEKPPLVKVTDEDTLDDLFSNKAVVEYGQPPSNPGAFRMDDFPKPARRAPARLLPTQREDNVPIEMDTLPPAYASKEVSYVSLNSKSYTPTIRAPSVETGGRSSVDWLDHYIPIRVSVTPVDSSDDTPMTIRRPQMTRNIPVPDVESPGGSIGDGEKDDISDKVSGRVRFETLWLPGKSRKKNKTSNC